MGVLLNPSPMQPKITDKTNREYHLAPLLSSLKALQRLERTKENSNHAFAIQNKRKVEIHKEILLE
jgi:polysaccharide deacetylase 2 family uncharacterized protein YibQ